MARKKTNNATPRTTSTPRRYTPAAPGRSRTTTAVRNSAIPKTQQSSAPKTRSGGAQVTHEMIAKRAYEIWQSGQGGSEHDNWCRAERELRTRR